jgi:hypothetical protein
MAKLIQMKFRITLLLIFSSLQIFAQQDLLTKNKVVIQKELKSWIATFRNFKLEDFKLNDTITETLVKDTNNLLVAKASKNDATALLYIYDKNKKNAIDLFGGQARLEYKNGKYNFEDADDGGAIYLHNFTDKKSYKIGYNSFSFFAEEAIWISENVFVLAFIYNDIDYKVPTLIVGDIKENKLYTFDNKNKKCAGKIGSYTSKKLKSLEKRKK